MIDLLTKRYNSKKQYSPQSLEAFAKLIDLSGLPINARSMKYAAAKKTGQFNITKALMNWSNDRVC